MIGLGSDKNEHFLKLFPGGRLDPPVSDEVVDVRQTVPAESWLHDPILGLAGRRQALA